MPLNECIPYFEPATRISGVATAAVTGKRFVGISAAVPGGMSGFENVRVAHAPAGSKALGVACYDAAINEVFPIANGPGMIVPVTAGAAITAGQEVEVGTAGQAIPLAAGKSVGLAVDSAANGADAAIRLYT